MERAVRAPTGAAHSEPPPRGAIRRDDRITRLPMTTTERCPYCGHPGIHRGGGDGRICEDCDRCWAEQQRHERPPHHN